MGTIQYCLNSSTIRPAPLMEKIRIAGATGYKAIELWNDDLSAHQQSGGTLQEVKSALADAGLAVPTVIALHGWLGSTGSDHDAALGDRHHRGWVARAIGEDDREVVREDRAQVGVARRHRCKGAAFVRRQDTFGVAQRLWFR